MIDIVTKQDEAKLKELKQELQYRVAGFELAVFQDRDNATILQRKIIPVIEAVENLLDFMKQMKRTIDREVMNGERNQ